MKSASLFLFSLLGACLLLAGCATPPRASGISVTVEGFRSEDTVAGVTRVIMTLRFTSENINAVALTSTSHQLYFAGHYVGKAENPSPVGVPPMGTVTQDVTFDFESPTVVRQVLSVADQAPYRLETTLFFTEDDSKRRLKITSEGKVPLLGLEHAAR